MADKHSRAKSKGDFCAVAGQPTCGCSINADYIGVCRPSWGSYSFSQKIKGRGTHQKVFEAHHILCAASVGNMIVDAAGKGVATIVKETEWCINTKKNMLAMPLWGHTVQWYCNVDEKTLGSPKRGPPAFHDLPQHDWDHTGKLAYQSEVDGELVKIVKNLKRAGHDASSFDLAGALDGLSDDFMAKLKSRGSARGAPPGTHNGWSNGRKQVKNWYPPFSMASDGCITAKDYPNLDFNDEFMKKLKWLAQHLR